MRRGGGWLHRRCPEKQSFSGWPLSTNFCLQPNMLTALYSIYCHIQEAGQIQFSYSFVTRTSCTQISSDPTCNHLWPPIKMKALKLNILRIKDQLIHPYIIRHAMQCRALLFLPRTWITSSTWHHWSGLRGRINHWDTLPNALIFRRRLLESPFFFP